MKIGRILELVYPENIYCISCGSIIDSTRPYALCDSCMDAFHWQTGRTCRICGKGLSDTYQGELCYSCLEDTHVFDQAFSCVMYGLNERAVIMDYKYGNKAYIGRKLAEIMKDRMENVDISYDYVVPVPIHRERRKKRGYDQAEILAKEFAKLTGTKYNQCVKRIRNTKPMKGISGDERMQNVLGAFQVTGDVAGCSILLVDDIITTGATLDEIAGTMKKSGADKVYGLGFASGMNRRPLEYDE